MVNEYKPYDQRELESIRKMLESESREGTPLFFDVKLDGRTVIQPTIKVERFNEVYNFINENSQKLVIAIYRQEESPVKDWYKFLLNGAVDERLNGVPDLAKMLDEKMQAFKEQTATERLKEKLKDTEEKLEAAEAYIDTLTDQLLQLKIKPNHLGEWDLGRLAASAIKELALSHPKILERVPVLNGISKVIQEDNRTLPKSDNPTFEGEMSFKAKSPSQPEEEKTQKEKEQLEVAIGLSQFIDKHFNEDQRVILGSVIGALGEDTSQLIPVAELLNIELTEEEGE